MKGGGAETCLAPFPPTPRRPSGARLSDPSNCHPIFPGLAGPASVEKIDSENGLMEEVALGSVQPAEGPQKGRAAPGHQAPCPGRPAEPLPCA